MSKDLVATWEVPLSDKVHRIEFEHGTISGKRIVRVDGEEIIHKDWMFKLIGIEEFFLKNVKCVIQIDSEGGFSYVYSLIVDGKPLQKMIEIQNNILETWIVNLDGEKYRVVLERDTLDVYANGEKLDTTADFVDNGTETHFVLGQWPACIKATTSGNKREGILYHLIVNDNIVPKKSERD